MCSRVALASYLSRVRTCVFRLSILSKAAKSVEVETELEMQKQGLVKQADREAIAAALAAKALEDRDRWVCICSFTAVLSSPPAYSLGRRRRRNT
jgi:hypothetical protein